MRKSKLISLLLVLTMTLALLAGCGGGDTGGESGTTPPSTNAPEGGTAEAPVSSIKIGIVNPSTGPMAGFGEGCPWTENLLVDYVNNELGGLSFEAYGDTKLPIEIIYYDSKSDTTTCTQMAQKLVEEDKVNLLIARHTPETVNPVSQVAERYGVPCVAIEAPVDAWLAEGPYEWTFHSFWTLDMMYEQYSAMWEQAGFPKGSGAKIGLAFANDADGTAWHGVFADRIVADGYTLVDPGQYPAGSSDFSNIVKTFMDEGVQILCGTNITPDFNNLWLQSKQLGFSPEFVTMGKAYLLESDALSIGTELMDGNCAEVWWSPDHPYQSALTGMNPKALTDLYMEQEGRNITQPIGYKYASMEPAIAGLQNAKSLEPEDIRDGIAAVDVDTIVGHIAYDQGDENAHWGKTPLAGGQWQLQEDGTLKLVIINNVVNPEIPVTGEVKKK